MSMARRVGWLARRRAPLPCGDTIRAALGRPLMGSRQATKCARRCDVTRQNRRWRPLRGRVAQVRERKHLRAANRRTTCDENAMILTMLAGPATPGSVEATSTAGHPRTKADARPAASPPLRIESGGQSDRVLRAALSIETL
jgi:hypothetical protein